MNKRRQEAGFVNLIYMGVIAIISVLVLIGSYSRLLSALQQKSFLADSLAQEYAAESVVDSYLSLYYQGRLESVEVELPRTEKVNGSTLQVSETTAGLQKSIGVALTKGLYTSSYNLYYPVQTSGSVPKVVIALDCTSEANQLILGNASQAVELSVLGYGENVAWLQDDNGRYGCGNASVGETASPGGAMVYLNNYLSSTENATIILVVEGEPESVKLSSDSECFADTDCTLCGDQALEYLACAMADTNTKWDRYSKGDRSPQTQLYVINVATSRLSRELNDILRKYASKAVFIPDSLELGGAVNQLVSTAGNQSYRATVEKVVE